MKIIWFRDRFFTILDPQNGTSNLPPNHVKSMLKPILGQDGSNKRSFIAFMLNFHGFLIDVDVIFVRYSNHVAFNCNSIWDWLRDACCNRIRYSFKLLPFGVHRIIIPVNRDSMKTTAARSTANGQPPFHSSFSYCGWELNVAPSTVCKRQHSYACEVWLGTPEILHSNVEPRSTKASPATLQNAVSVGSM